MKELSLMERKEIADKAKEMLTANKVSMNDPIDVVSLAKNLGFLVGSSALNPEDEGLIMVDDNAKEILGQKTQRLILVNESLEPNKKRFVIAHELGHFALHYKENQIFAHRDGEHGRSDDENDVDFFAACLLMPEDGFKVKYNEILNESKDFIRTIGELEKIYKVPTLSIMRRCDELSLSRKGD